MKLKNLLKGKSNRIKYIGLFLFLALLAYVVVFFYVHKEYNKDYSYLSGDEPHYIMMTDSLVKDGEFNLRNDYEQKRSEEYYPAPLFPHVSPVFSKESPEWYSIHTFGLPIVISVPYKLFGLDGARIFMILLQVSSVFILYGLLKKYTGSVTRARLGAGILLLCPLFWQNLGSIYPDLLIASMWGAVLLLFGKKDTFSNVAIMTILLLATLAHSKGMVLIAPVVLLHLLWLIKKQGVKQWFKEQWLSNAIIATGVLAYVYYLRVHYGVWTPGGVYGGNGQLFSTNPLINTIALLTDRSKGILVHFPLLVVVLPYLFMVVRDAFKFLKGVAQKQLKHTKNNYLLVGLILSVTAYLITTLSFNDWSGATGPNGRSMICIILLSIFLVAKYINLKNWLELAIVGSFVALSAWVSWLSINDFVYYMSVGVDSFWVDRFPLLENLPLFPLVADHASRAELYKGAKIVLVLLVLNTLLFALYQYRVTFQKWQSK